MIYPQPVLGSIAVGALSFLYGLVGCAFYSYGQVIKGRAPNFFTSIGKSIIVAFLSQYFL